MRNILVDANFNGVKFGILNEDLLNVDILIHNRPHWSNRQIKKFINLLNTLASDGNVNYFDESEFYGHHLISHYCTYGMAAPMLEIDKILRKYNDYKTPVSEKFPKRKFKKLKLKRIKI